MAASCTRLPHLTLPRSNIATLNALLPFLYACVWGLGLVWAWGSWELIVLFGQGGGGGGSPKIFVGSVGVGVKCLPFSLSLVWFGPWSLEQTSEWKCGREGEALVGV